MADTETINIPLAPEWSADIEAAIARGDYASADEIIRDALRVWKQARESQAAKTKALRSVWRETTEHDFGQDRKARA